MPVGEALSPKGTVRAANPWGTKRSTVRSVAHQISELNEFDLARKRGSEFGIRGEEDSKSELLLSRIPNPEPRQHGAESASDTRRPQNPLEPDHIQSA